VPGSADRPVWKGSAEALDGWNVFWATLQEGSIHSTLQLGDSSGSDPPEDERVFRGQVVTILRGELERNPYDPESEAFRVLVATAPWNSKLIRIASYARPTPGGCERVPSVELVQRVLREVFGVDDLPSPTEEAVYVVDLSLPESAGRYQLFGPATTRREERIRALRAVLEALLRRTSADFPIELGHRLRVNYLSNGKALVNFSQRREQIGSEVLDALPDLRSAAAQDLRSRLSV
jgi:hypothetical protein